MIENDSPQYRTLAAAMTVRHGIPVAHAGDDGEMLALGHHSGDALHAAFAAEETALVGDAENVPAQRVAEQAQHTFAVLTHEPPQWELRLVGAEEPGAFPVTWLDRP